MHMMLSISQVNSQCSGTTHAATNTCTSTAKYTLLILTHLDCMTLFHLHLTVHTRWIWFQGGRSDHPKRHRECPGIRKVWWRVPWDLCRRVQSASLFTLTEGPLDTLQLRTSPGLSTSLGLQRRNPGTEVEQRVALPELIVLIIRHG